MSGSVGLTRAAVTLWFMSWSMKVGHGLSGVLFVTIFNNTLKLLKLMNNSN